MSEQDAERNKIIRTCLDWRSVMAAHLYHPGEYYQVDHVLLEKLRQQVTEISNWCRRHTNVDPSVLHEMYQRMFFEPPATQSERKALWTRCVFTLDLIREQAGTGRGGDSDVLFHGDGLYTCGDNAIRLEGSQAYVLEALVELRAATKDDLVRQSGVDDAPRVLRTIRKANDLLAPAIRLPGGKGKGGYATTIRKPDAPA